jgi:hypothetical protein
MLYTIFVLSFGVYIGQEYENVPPIKLLVNSALVYLTNYLGSIEQDPPKIPSWYELLSSYILKN